MKLQAINAQPLRQAVSFKAEPAVQTAPAAAQGKKMSNKAIAGWTIGAAAALGAIWYAVSAAKKGKVSAVAESDAFKAVKEQFNKAKETVEKAAFKEGENEVAVDGGKLLKTTAQDGVVTFQKMVGEKQDQKAFEYIVKKTDEKTETIFKDFIKIVENDGKKTETFEKEAQSTFVQLADKENKLVSQELTAGAKTELYIADEKGEKLIAKAVAEDGKITEKTEGFDAEIKDGKIELKKAETKETPAAGEGAKTEGEKKPDVKTEEAPKTPEEKKPAVKTEGGETPKTEGAKADAPKTEAAKAEQQPNTNGEAPKVEPEVQANNEAKA